MSGITVATLAEARVHPAWKTAFDGQRKDGRYYQIVEETLSQGFEHGYFILQNQAGQTAIQPFFMHNQDILAGAGAKVLSAVARVRNFFPRFLTLRTLMVGCAAGEGRLDAANEERGAWIGQMLADHLRKQSKALGCGMVVMKEFHFHSRSALKCLTQRGFTRVPSLPMTRLNIAYPNFDDYMNKALSKATRKNLRRKFRLSGQAGISMEVRGDVSDCIDEVYPLYLSVYQRSSLHFEKLTKDFFCRLGWEIGDKVRYFLWRRNGRAIAFSLCMISGDTLYDEYLGLDYSVALDVGLYFHTIRDIIQWGMEQGYQWYCSSALNYDPKLHLRCELLPLDLYVRHTSPVINFFLARFLPWLEPTRNDKTLGRFANAGDMWGKP